MLYLSDIWEKQNDATIKTQEYFLDSEHIYDWQYIISPKKLLKNRISVITGPRRIGKSTFLEQLVEKLYKSEYISDNDCIIMGISNPSLFMSGLLQYLLADRMKKLPNKIFIVDIRTLKDLAHKIRQIRYGSHRGRFIFLMDNIEYVRNMTLQDILQDHETFRREDCCILISNCYPSDSFFIQCQLSPEVATYRLRSAG